MPEHDSMPERSRTKTADEALQRFVDARQAALISARKALGVNELDVRALLYVDAHPGARPSHLRDHLGITAAGVTTLVDRLAERQILRRDVDEADRRVNRITLSIDLETEPWSALTRFDRRIAEAASALGPVESAKFSSTLDALVAATR